MKIILFLTVFLLSISSYAQYFNNGQDRSNINWKKIETINFEVIFPDGFEKKANLVANMMEKSYEYTTVTLKQKPKKISIILHTETVKSNAFLGWAPSRIEMYATPHQRIYSQDWLEQLAIHEYRHMVQVSKLETEMPKILKWVFGEQAAALLTAAYMPFWFLEGDAVSTETGLSYSGRGRFPDFHRELKAQIVDNEIYSYDKAYLGSFKDHVANYYKMGYFMVGGARMLYGKTIWEEVVHNISRNPLSLVPFDNGLKKTIGIRKTELYDTVFNYLEERWKAEDKLINPSAFNTISKSTKTYINYKFSHKISDSTYFAEKSSLADINRFVTITEKGDEKIIFTPGYHFQESVSGHKKYIVWSERKSHLRWDHSDRSLIRIFNIETNELNEYEFDTKFFAPSFSPNLEQIVVVEVDNLYQFYLNIIDRSNGEIVKRISMPDNDFFITPSFSADGKNILAVSMHDNKKAIIKINIESETSELLLPFENQEIIKPQEFDGDVYFIGGYTGNDNLYVIKKENNKVYEVITSRFGIADFSFDDKNIIYSNYTAQGYQLVRSNLDSLQFKLVKLQEIQKNYPIAEVIAKQEKGVIDFSDQDDVTYKVEKYKKAEHLFNFHSWAPLAIDPYTQRPYNGVSIMSQNHLNTAEFVGGYRYFFNKNEGELFASFRYLGWYPIIKAEINSGNENLSYRYLQPYVNARNEIVKVDTLDQNYSIKNTDFYLYTYIPFDFSKGKYYRSVIPKLYYQISNFNYDDRAHESFLDGYNQYLGMGLYMHQILKTSEQDLLSDFGVVLNLTYNKSLPGVNDFGSLFAVSNWFYLPGIMANHGITIYNGFQIKERTDNGFNDNIQIPRGHHHILNDKMYSFQSDYQLPLMYPDLNIAGLAYIKRVKLKVFYDFAFYKGTSNFEETSFNYSGKQQSTGLEFIVDANFLRFIAPIELGFRSSYLFNNSYQSDFLFKINFVL